MSTSCPVQSVSVHRAEAFRVTIGANLGDAISHVDDLVADDVYVLSPDAKRERLAVDTDAEGRLSVAPGSALGRPGAALHLDCAITLMAEEGHNSEALILVEVDAEHHIAAIYLLPLAPLDPETEYRLVGLDRDGARRKFAKMAFVSFARGTHLAMASGAQVRIEDLRVGDRVLTRDDGPQTVRWIGHSTLRATGEFAPIVIRAGALGNANDLIVGPDHRLFIYQRSDRLGTGARELLIKARHLVNGDTVVRQEGGFVDYFQILFDRHHIVYAEGIAAESLRIDSRTRPALPAELQDRLAVLLPGHGKGGVHGLDVQETLLDNADTLERLRRASRG